jgi:hypothetical protein
MTSPVSEAGRDFITSYAAEHAEASEQSELFWLSPPDANQGDDDYCDECIGFIAALPTLVFCHLNLLRGETVVPGVHRFIREDGSHSRCCEVCDEWKGYAADLKCWDAPRQAIEWNKAAIDGGWSGESDGWRYCANCDKSLRVNLTDYGVEEELRHWKHYGPPSRGADWWQFSEMVERLTRTDPKWPAVYALFAKWGLLPARLNDRGD